MPSFIESAKQNAIDEFKNSPRARVSGHPLVWRAEKYYLWARHAFAVALVKAGYVPTEVKQAVENAARENVEQVERRK
jgi:hypothetical protein